MWVKAKVFNDIEIAVKILKQNNPKIIKALGRKVHNYNNKIWNNIRYYYMFKINLAKYTQNNDLKLKLLSSEYINRVFVEASPYDNIWGIKMKINDPNIEDSKNWNGQNLLGCVLTSIRDNFLKT